jgi:hypothetical protein
MVDFVGFSTDSKNRQFGSFFLMNGLNGAQIKTITIRWKKIPDESLSENKQDGRIWIALI